MSLSNKQEKNVSSIIGPKVEVVGTITATGGILIYGKVYGDVKAAGMVRISQGGFVKGSISAKEARINGTVEGDLYITKKIELNNKSILKGNLSAGILVIEEGATFEGNCSMDDHSSANVTGAVNQDAGAESQ